MGPNFLIWWALVTWLTTFCAHSRSSIYNHSDRASTPSYSNWKSMFSVCQSFLAWNLGRDCGVYLYMELLWAFVWLISLAWEAFQLFLESWDLCLDVDFSALCWCLLLPNIIVSWKILTTFYISPRIPGPAQNCWVIEQAWAFCAICWTKSIKIWSKQLKNICVLHGICRAQATILFMEYKYNPPHCSQADTHCQLLIVFGMLQLGTWNQCTAPSLCCYARLRW